MMRLGQLTTVLGLLVMTYARAEAAMLTLNFSGEFGPTTTLGGTALGANTAFTFAATFDSTMGTTVNTGVAIFPTVVTFDITGFGTYSSALRGQLVCGAG